MRVTLDGFVSPYAQVCTYAKSLSAAKILLSAGVGCIAYLRGILPEECFGDSKPVHMQRYILTLRRSAHCSWAGVSRRCVWLPCTNYKEGICIGIRHNARLSGECSAFCDLSLIFPGWAHRRIRKEVPAQCCAGNLPCEVSIMIYFIAEQYQDENDPLK